MTAFDSIVLILVCVAAFFGLMRGFVSEALSLMAWGAGALSAKLFQPALATALTGMIGTAAGASVIGFALSFGLAFIVVRMLAKNLGAWTRKSLLGPVDRLLGAGFGAVKGLIGATILFFLITTVVDVWVQGAANRPGWLTQSKTYALLTTTSSAMSDFVKAREAVPPDNVSNTL